MKTLFTITLLVISCIALRGQAGFELQFGGSNFLGITLNSSYEVFPIKDHKFSITPYFGIGTMIMPFSESAIVKGGLIQRIGKWGMGIEASGFFENPFVPAFQDDDFIDMLVYPSCSYTTDREKKIYYRISLGAYFAFNKGFAMRQGGRGMQFAGDVIPGLGLTIGHRL